MNSSDTARSLAAEVAAHVPYLRRYARALTGTQGSGDRYALAALEAVVADPDGVGDASSVKVGLFRAFHQIWSSSGTPVASEDDGAILESRAQWRLSGLTANTREALLLKSVEEFSFDEVAAIMQVETSEAEDLYEMAQDDLARLVTGSVLIIEDEAIIAMDLQSIVSAMGHRVTGIARTYDGAVALGAKETPDLILADIQLADKSSGIDAVNSLLAKLGERPVIFITAFPERLLSGEKPEPPFLITKPYSEEQVRAAVSQAMFFATTEEMETIA
ncbi:response regulator [Silicimonas algicola]|uniref:Response regulator receiver protein n=1 Tax=Silicimonas algicola TaxID=1826607 RepID=A0A316G8W6_9RHOB|nr:response regulator [Silicimonas algicola]AZQ67380.1 response regulator [Silicimonas algicola]PWK57062.1 response regulator receiver protein [Silicimonas algicola]